MLSALRQVRTLGTHRLRKLPPMRQNSDSEISKLEAAVAGAFSSNPERSVEGIVRSLTPEQRTQLLRALSETTGVEVGQGSNQAGHLNGLPENAREPEPADLSKVDTERNAPELGTLLRLGVATGIPFIGFGFLDNFIMIVAGESLELHFGVAFGLSTMAAAGFGNILSDIAGLGMADQIEVQARKVGIGRPPELSTLQHQLFRTRAARVTGSAVGVTIGGFIGMVPLLWI
eukprot:jgi/Botrbrau1/23463/Bobra.106_1s0018.1